MTSNSIIVQQPRGPVSSLVLLTHGVGSVPQSMLGVARWFAERDRDAMVVSIASAEPSDISNGLQWFSVRDVTEQNRQGRVDAAMQVFLQAVRHWQQTAGVDAQHTLIAGFSQGAIMALESTKLSQPCALRVVAMAGRFATLPTKATPVAIQLLYGDADAVMPAALGRAAQERLLELGARRHSIQCRACGTSLIQIFWQSLQGGSQSMVNALIKNARKLPQELYKSLTWDRGTEMHGHKRFTMATDIQVYFCDPQSPWQRGSNENTNGLLRQYMPKGIDISGFSQLNAIARQLNERPRKTLGFHTLAEMFSECVASTG